MRRALAALLMFLATGGHARAQTTDCIVLESFASSSVGAFPAGWAVRAEEGRPAYMVQEEDGRHHRREHEGHPSRHPSEHGAEEGRAGAALRPDDQEVGGEGVHGRERRPAGGGPAAPRVEGEHRPQQGERAPHDREHHERISAHCHRLRLATVLKK